MSSLGIEWGAKYTLVGPDGTTVVFNDSSDPNFIGVLSPESSGLDSPDVREDGTDATEEDGGHHGDFFEGRRPVVLQGTIIASSATQRNERVGKLKRATRALRRDATLTWKIAGSVEVELALRRQQPLRVTKGYTKDFQVGMVAADIFPKAKTKQTKSVTIATQTKSSTKFASTQTGIHFGAFGEEETSTWSPATGSRLSAADGLYTVAEPLATPQNSVSLVGSVFGFAIPETATILGVEMGILRRTSGAGGSKDYRIRLVNNGVGSVNKAVTTEDWPTTAAWATYGGRSDLSWGTSPITPANVNKNGANEFGVAIHQQRGSGFNAGEKGEVDAAKLTIYYEEAAAPSNTVSCTNNGDTTAWPTVTIKGYIENPIIKNTTTGEEIKLEGIVPEGQSLVIDFKNHTIKLNGSYAYYFLNFASSRWWGIEPGANTISVSGEYATATAKLEVAWQDTFV